MSWSRVHSVSETEFMVVLLSLSDDLSCNRRVCEERNWNHWNVVNVFCYAVQKEAYGDQ